MIRNFSQAVFATYHFAPTSDAAKRAATRLDFFENPVQAMRLQVPPDPLLQQGLVSTPFLAIFISDDLQHRLRAVKGHLSFDHRQTSRLCVARQPLSHDDVQAV